MNNNILGWIRHHYTLCAGRGRIAIATLALLCGCAPILNAQTYTPTTMKSLPTERTTHCIGRYLIDLPSNFELESGGWGDIELYYGLDKNFKRVYATVKQGRYTSEEFWEEVNKRRFELDAQKNSETKGSMLLLGEQINSTSALLRRLGNENYASSIKTEVHVLVGSRYVTLEQTSHSKDESDITYLKADPAPAEARLKMIASKLLDYENAARAKPGFCMQGVLFDVGQDDEVASFDFVTKDFPDVQITVDYHAVTGQPREGLLQRVDEGMRSLPGADLLTKVFRRGDRPLGGQPAQEYTSKSTRPVTQHLFYLERRDTAPRTLDRPFFDLQLFTGKDYVTPVEPGQRPPPSDKTRYMPREKMLRHLEDNSSLSDTQVLKLWEDTVASVRKR